MKFELRENLDRDECIYTITISHAEFMRGTIYQFDRALIAECEASNKISDKILALETIVRRAEASYEASSAEEKK